MIVYISCFKSKLICPGAILGRLSNRFGAPKWFAAAVKKVFPQCQEERGSREVRVRIIEDDIRSFPETVSLVMVPMLQRLMESDESRAPEGLTEKEWLDALESMIYAFERNGKGNEDDSFHVEYGLNLFAKHFGNMGASDGKDKT